MGSRQATFLKLRTKRLGTLENENVAYIWTHFINFSIKYLSFWQLSTLNAMVLPTLPKTPTLFQSGSSKLPNGHFSLWSPTSLFRFPGKKLCITKETHVTKKEYLFPILEIVAHS